MKFVAVALSFLLLSSSFINASLHEHTLNDAGKTDGWIKNARIMTPYAYNTTWKEGVAEAVADGANVILDWANFSDSYYGRILEFNNSLEKFRERAEYVHSRYPGIKYMVYFAPFEMQTYDSDMNMDGRDDDGKNSTYTDHPEWLQVGIDGRKAVFYGSMPDMPFWVSEHDEDVWLSPSNEEYRNIIMNEATAIAEAGADAVWFDVPHLLFDYGNGWQSQWCTVDDASRMAFYNDTGLILPSPPLKPSWDNETWLKFVEWRYRQVIDFVKQFNEALKAGNENCRLAVETSVNGLFITQYGCDIEKLPEACDVIAHEYGGPFYEMQYYSWMDMLATLKTWYDFDKAHNKETSWLLSYVKHGKTELARFHAALLLTTGFNYYTSGNIGMSGMVDRQFMHDLFSWIDGKENYFYGLDDNAEIAVVFSRHTLDYMDRGSWEGYAYHDGFRGIIMMLIESNIPFKVITENELNSIKKFKLVILPDFACMNESEAEIIRNYVENGGRIIAINDTSLYTAYGVKRENFLLHDVFGVNSSEVSENKIYENEYGSGMALFTKMSLGRYFIWAAQPWSNYSHKNEAESVREEFISMVKKLYASPYEIDGNAVAMAYSNGKENIIRILNFNGIKWKNSQPEQQYIEIKIRGNVTKAKLLDFMGDWREPDMKREGEHTIISFVIGEQATLVYSLNESKLYVKFLKPERGRVYIMDREIYPISSDISIVIGSITIQADTDGKEVEFYVDDELKYADYTPPYTYLWNERAIGMREIKVVAYDDLKNEASDDMDVLAFIL